MAMATPNHVYEDFDPPSDMVSEQECDTILVYLPGFKKEQLRVQLTIPRILKVSGERPIGNNKWRRFHKEFRVSPNYNTKGITAKFEGGILYIRQPKLITPTTPEQIQQETPKAQSQPQPQTPLPQQEGESKAEKQEDATTRKDKEEMPSKDEERKDQCESRAKRVKKVVAGSVFFKELRKPENLKKLVVSVLMVVIVGFCISNMFKSFTRKEQQTLLQYNQHL